MPSRKDAWLGGAFKGVGTGWSGEPARSGDLAGRSTGDGVLRAVVGAAKGAMTHFVGTHFGKLDRKGRISVPAPFRAELEAAGVTQIAFRMSHQLPCIEARSRADFERIVDSIRRLDSYSEEREAWEAGFISVTEMLRFDGEGRLVLPEHMIAALGLPEGVAFLGKSDRFEIWEAEAGRAHVAEQLAAMREKRFRLPALPLNATPRGMP